MHHPAEKLPFKARLASYALLLLLTFGLYNFVDGAGFLRGFAFGLLAIGIPGELILYLRRRKAKQYPGSPV